MQDLVFVQVTFEKCTPNLCFEKRRDWYKNDDCQFAALICMERFGIFTDFYAALSTIKMCFYETRDVFYTKRIITKLVSVF